MTIQIEIGTVEQYEKIVRLLNRLKVRFTKQEDMATKSSSFDMTAYRNQISQVSVWTEADIHAMKKSTQNFNWTASEW